MNKKHRILQLQDKYLKTKDKNVLGEFYVEVLKYTKHILKVSGRTDRIDDAYSLASQLSERLIVEQKQVITKTPAGYLNSAIRYMGKPTKELLMFDWLSTRLSESDPDDSEYQAYVDEVLRYIYCPERIHCAVEKCLRDKENVDGVRETIPEADKKIFDLVMDQVKLYTERRLSNNAST